MNQVASAPHDGGDRIEVAIALFVRERDAIWLEAPAEIRDLGRGASPRGIGSRGQYLTPIMFAEGAARSFADETLWCLIEMCDRPGLDLMTLKTFAAALSRKKAGFFELMGLEHLAAMTLRFVEEAEAAPTPADLARLAAAFSSYINRAHVWIDAAFPWGLCSGFMRTTQRA